MLKLRAGEKALRAVQANAGIGAAYRRKLCAFIDAMARSYAYWIKAQYRAEPPRLAQDATPAAELQRELRKLGKRWQERIDDAAPALAKWFLTSSANRSDAVLRGILRQGGWSVKFKMTPGVRDVIDAIVGENVSLIKSIPQQFHTEVEGLVMRSVKAGGDLQQLTGDLQKRFGVTRRRAEIIAHDQNRKATSAMMKVRQTDLGIEDGIWLHSHAGKAPRKTHLANHGKRFNIRDGWFDPDPKVRKRIWPGELIECKCSWKPVVKGFS
jgi:uncharacterized protein with gpF-like domain